MIEELGLQHNQECSREIYIAKSVLSQEPEYGGITIRNQGEIITVKPETIIMTEQATQTDSAELLNFDRDALQEQLNTLQAQFDYLSLEHENTKNVLIEVEKKLVNKNTQIGELTNQLNNSQARIDMANNIIDNLNQQINSTIEEDDTNQLREQIVALQTQLTNLQARFVSLTRERNNLQAEFASEQAFRRAAEQQRNQIRQELQTRTAERDRRPDINQRNYDELQRQNHYLNARINDLESQRITELIIDTDNIACNDSSMRNFEEIEKKVKNLKKLTIYFSKNQINEG